MKKKLGLAALLLAFPVLVGLGILLIKLEGARKVRARVAKLGEDEWCTCTETHECEGHRA